jgi:hypothetical protein
MKVVLLPSSSIRETRSADCSGHGQRHSGKGQTDRVRQSRHHRASSRVGGKHVDVAAPFVGDEKIAELIKGQSLGIIEAGGKGAGSCRRGA